jgi:hypothetical protein
LPQNCEELWQIGPGFFMNLRVVELDEFFISEPEIAFLRFILGSAPLLEQLTIVRDKDTGAKEKDTVVEMLRGIAKLSTNLEITLE